MTTEDTIDDLSQPDHTAALLARIGELEYENKILEGNLHIVTGERDRYLGAEAELIEARATIERLKVCGNCGRWGLLGLELESASVCRHMLTHGAESCHFTPSRWAKLDAERDAS